ncbi:integrating conjugative element protein [Salmonella enterica]|nr:integrating conjugative element protein [Salmonella enterica]
MKITHHYKSIISALAALALFYSAAPRAGILDGGEIQFHGLVTDEAPKWTWQVGSPDQTWAVDTADARTESGQLVFDLRGKGSLPFLEGHLYEVAERGGPGFTPFITFSSNGQPFSVTAGGSTTAQHFRASVPVESAVGDEYRDAINRSGGDATRAEQAKDKATGEEGATWIGGKKAGGKGQPAIQPVRDMAKAGYNMLNGQPVTSNSSVTSSACNGSSCQIFKNSDAAATAIVQVLGDRSIRTCKDKSQCESGGTDNAPGASVAGTGFGPLLDESTKVNLEALSKLVSSQGAPSAEELGKLKTGGLPVTRGVIEALRDDTDKNALVQRLAGELAMAHTIETALAMRRILTTGESEPNAAAQKQAIEEGDRRIDSLDRELQALKNEMELRRAISSNSLLVTLERQEVRNSSNQMQQRTPSTDEGMNSLNQKGGE